MTSRPLCKGWKSQDRRLSKPERPYLVKAVSMRRFWTTVEMRELRRIYPNMLNAEIGKVLGRTESAVMMMALDLGLHKLPELMAALRFQKGNRPWNVGKSCSYPGSRATQFKKGQRGPRQRRVGEERMERDGLFVKVAEPDVWIPKARLMWQQHFGPIPAGSIVRLKDGNNGNCAPENLMLMCRAAHLKANVYPRRRHPKPIAWLSPLQMAV